MPMRKETFILIFLHNLRLCKVRLSSITDISLENRHFDKV